MTSHGYEQNEISQELSMGTKIFKTSYRTVLKAFSFKKIKILSATLRLVATPALVDPLTCLVIIFQIWKTFSTDTLEFANERTLYECIIILSTFYHVGISVLL